MMLKEFLVNGQRMRLDETTVMEFRYGYWQAAVIDSFEKANQIRKALSADGIEYRWVKPREQFVVTPVAKEGINDDD